MFQSIFVEPLTPSLDEEEKSYPIFGGSDENTFSILLPTNLLISFSQKYLTLLIDKYQNKNLNLSNV